jgi:hypothetical protein
MRNPQWQCPVHHVGGVRPASPLCPSPARGRAQASYQRVRTARSRGARWRQRPGCPSWFNPFLRFTLLTSRLYNVLSFLE